MRFLAVAVLLVAMACFPAEGHSCCDQGWLKFGSHCYFFNHDKQGQGDWHNASQACHLLGGHLLDIRNEAEWTFVKSLLQPGANIDQYFIDMSDRKRERSWKYTDGTPVTFLKWRRGEPNGGKSENCGSLYSTQIHIGLYNDAPCKLRLGRFICKKNAA